jgi:hypothetical protein
VRFAGRDAAEVRRVLMFRILSTIIAVIEMSQSKWLVGAVAFERLALGVHPPFR